MSTSGSSCRNTSGFGIGRRYEFVPALSLVNISGQSSACEKMDADPPKRRRKKSVRISVSATRKDKQERDIGSTEIPRNECQNKRIRSRKTIIRRPLHMARIPFPDLADWPNEDDDDSISTPEDLQMCLTGLGSLAIKALTAVSSADNKTTLRLNASGRNGNQVSAGYLEQSYHDLYGKHIAYLQEIISDVPTKTEERTERLRTHVNINALINDSRENTPTPISEGRPLSNQVDCQKRGISECQAEYWWGRSIADEGGGAGIGDGGDQRSSGSQGCKGQCLLWDRQEISQDMACHRLFCQDDATATGQSLRSH